MGQSVSYITQSKYYSSAFNSAIFDGPVRIYFAQYQESLALNVYFKIQNDLKQFSDAYGVAYKSLDSKIFVMLYPTDETYREAFGESENAEIQMGSDWIIGVQGALSEDDHKDLIARVRSLVAKSLLGDLKEKPAAQGPVNKAFEPTL